MVSLGRVPLPSSFASAFRFRQRWHSRTFSQLVIAPCHSCHRLAFPAQQRWSTRAQAQSQQANNKGCAGQDPTSGDSREGSDEKGDVAQDTELILKLDRRGSGWGEEIFPHVTWERREVNPPKRRRRRDNNPDPWEVILTASCPIRNPPKG